MHWIRGVNCIVYITTLVNDDYCEWYMWLVIDIVKLSLLFYAPLTCTDVFSPLFVSCVVFMPMM